MNHVTRTDSPSPVVAPASSLCVDSSGRFSTKAKTHRLEACATTAASLIVAVALVFSAGCSKKSPPSDVLAHVGDRAITVADFKAEYERRTANRLPLPDRAVLLEQMVARETLLQSAKSAGLDQNSEVRRACEDVLISKLKATQLEPQLDAVKVLPEEIQAAYEKEITRYTQPAKVQLAFIFIAVDAKADTNQVAAAAARTSEARQIASALPVDTRGFGQVAADFSADQITRYRGGDAGWFSAEALEERWPKAVVAAGFDLKNSGDISDALRAANGFYLVKKMDSRAAVVAPLEQVSAAISHHLLIAKKLATEEKFSASARAAAKVSTDTALLATVSYPAPNPTAAATTPPALPNSK